ncbi:MAG: ABC transporter ATP-binding protein, partial [Candidatus Angelobacter sp.]
MANQLEKKKSAAEQLRSVMPMIWELVRPRRGLLAVSFVILLIGRLAGLVLPASTKFLIDDVITKHDSALLWKLVALVAGATLVQGLSSFGLTQLLSKEAQRLITELRRRVQAHVGRLPLNYYDSNKTGALVSRIMSDVEGIRNLIGTGLIEFAGGILTAVLALGILLKINALMTGVALGFLLALMVAFGRAFKTIRPIFRERSKINAEVTGRLTESLGGVRVVKGYHAEEREADVFSSGVQRLLQNVLRTLNATSFMGLASTVMIGAVSAIIMYIGARQILAGHMTVGGLFSYTMFMGFLVAPVAQIAAIGTQITEALAGLDRTREVLEEDCEDADPERSNVLAEIEGHIVFDQVDFSYEPGKPVLEGVSFDSQPGTVTALVGSSGSGKSTMIGLVAAFYKPVSGRVMADGIDLSKVRLDSYRSALG